MDLHQIGTGLGIGSYAQQEQQQQSSTLTTTSTTTPSSSVSPSTTQRPQHFQQHQHQHQLYNLVPLAPQPHGSYSSSLPVPRSKDLLHQHQQQQQQYQPQQSNIKREIMGKHLDTSNGSKNEDDSMPSTSDFVKKLYKFVHLSFLSLSFSSNIDIFFLSIGFPCVCVGCWRILRFKMSYLGDRWGIVLSSKYVCFFLSLIPFYLSPFHTGYDRFHQVYSATNVQAFKFCEFR